MKILDRKYEQAAIIKDYKSVVWFYDFWSWLTESKAAKQVLDFSEIKNGETLLEVACGTGIVFEQMVKRNPDGKNYGIDLSPDMLEKAKNRLKKTENANYELREGNALHLDFPDNHFDLVINNFMVDLMPADTFGQVASEFCRVTKPNGRIIVSTFSFGNKPVHKFWFWLAKNFPALLTGCRPISFKKSLVEAGCEIETAVQLSQNTFPSEVVKARKSA